MIEELKSIRDELLHGAESADLLYIKMQINKIDSLILKLSNKDNSNFSLTLDNIRNYVQLIHLNLTFIPKYEYKTIYTEKKALSTDNLNELGEEGWNLIEVIHSPAKRFLDGRAEYIFKRKIK